MEAGRSLRELFAELAHPGAGDPAAVLAAAGFGDVPHSLVAEAIVHYAATAPLEVAEHLAPFAVAHGPLPDLAEETAATTHGLSLLASAPDPDTPGDAPGHDETPDDLADHLTPDGAAVEDLTAGHVEHGSLGGDVDVDPSALDDPSGHVTSPSAVHGPLAAHGDPATLDGLDGLGEGHTGLVAEPHPDLGSFGVGHAGEVPTGAAGPVEELPHDASADDVDSIPVPDHDQGVEGDGLGVSEHQQLGTARDGAPPPLDHDPTPDRHDVVDGDAHHDT